jgi:hypothetical protein
MMVERIELRAPSAQKKGPPRGSFAIAGSAFFGQTVIVLAPARAVA